jgi:hypothetical protein
VFSSDSGKLRVYQDAKLGKMYMPVPFSNEIPPPVEVEWGAGLMNYGDGRLSQIGHNNPIEIVPGQTHFRIARLSRSL